VLPDEAIRDRRRHGVEDHETSRDPVWIHFGSRPLYAPDDRAGHMVHRLLWSEPADALTVVARHRVYELGRRRDRVHARYVNRCAGEFSAQRFREAGLSRLAGTVAAHERNSAASHDGGNEDQVAGVLAPEDR